MVIRKAEFDDLNMIIKIFKDAIKKMDESNIHQWDEIYPNEEILQQDILENQMYVGIKDNIIVSAVVVNDEFDEEYEDGNWQYDDSKFVIVHRLCVNPIYQNQGIGKNTMSMIESLLLKKGVQSIRLDAFSQNPYALKMYETLGYKMVGEANWRKGLFYLLEKKL